MNARGVQEEKAHRRARANRTASTAPVASAPLRFVCRRALFVATAAPPSDAPLGPRGLAVVYGLFQGPGTQGPSSRSKLLFNTPADEAVVNRG